MAKQATETLELSQATQMVQWLEEERRKDKALISTLEQRVKEQGKQLEEQATLLHELETTYAGMKKLVAQAATLDDVASSYKGDVSLMLDQREEAWKKEQMENARARQIEVERLKEKLDQMEKNMAGVRRFDADQKNRQAEQERLNQALQRMETALDDAQRRSDDRAQAVTYLEEQRRSDNRRIAELEQETTNLRKKTEAQASELLLMDDTLNKHKKQLDEALQQVKDEKKYVDDVRAEEFRREQKFAKFGEQMEQFGREMEEWNTQKQRFLEQYQENRRSLDNLESFQARVERRQNEVAEMQRLAEDRFKRQWEEWQATTVKEMKRYELVAEEQQRVQEKKNLEHDRDLGRLEDRLDIHRAAIEAFQEARRADVNRYTEAGRAEIEAVDQALAKEQDLTRRRRR